MIRGHDGFPSWFPTLRPVRRVVKSSARLLTWLLNERSFRSGANWRDGRGCALGLVCGRPAKGV